MKHKKDEIKILYVLEDGRLGGMSKMIFDIASRMNSGNISSKVLIAKAESDALLASYRNSGLSIQTVDITFLSKKAGILLRYVLNFIPDLYKICKNINHYNPTIVYCNGAQSIKGIISARILNKEIVWHMHDTYQPKAILSLFRITKTLFGVKYFVASSKRTIDFYKLPLDTTLLSIPPVDTQYFASSTFKKSSFDNSTIHIVTIANINPDKGLDTLVHTASLVNKEVSNVQFNIIGMIPKTQTKLFNRLNSLIKSLKIENIQFMGQRSDVREILADSDLYLCTSNNESGPIAVFEAMAMSIPIVTTDVGDLREILTINKSGKVHPVKDYKALANEIIYLIGKPDFMRTLGTKGQITAFQHLDIRHSILRHLQFYKKIISKKV